ncbi:helix-turn-helix domain-containing protein [Planococcus koreensis]|uniref:helix-turn-helix domain-containing protein n=1 Tax=Planococcus koreensis TaxID=112331 RepID=UPI0039FBA70B
MSELGNRLKEARIAKGYSLEDLQDVTKIQKRYLAGIEEGNHSMMPGPFYARAFIKQYAEAVGLDANDLLEQHKGEIPAPAKEEVRTTMVPPTPSRRQTFAKNSSRSSGMGEMMPKVIVALFIVVIIGVAWVSTNPSAPTTLQKRFLKKQGFLMKSLRIKMPHRQKKKKLQRKNPLKKLQRNPQNLKRA